MRHVGGGRLCKETQGSPERAKEIEFSSLDDSTSQTRAVTERRAHGRGRNATSDALGTGAAVQLIDEAQLLVALGGLGKQTLRDVAVMGSKVEVQM